MFFAGLLGWARHGSRFARLGRARPLVAIGSVSYGLYLFQLGVLGLLQGALRGWGLQVSGWPAVGLVVVAAATAFGLAWLAFRFLEAPILRWSRRWGFDGPGRPRGGGGVRGAKGLPWRRPR